MRVLSMHKPKSSKNEQLLDVISINFSIHHQDHLNDTFSGQWSIDENGAVTFEKYTMVEIEITKFAIFSHFQF